MSYVVFSLLVNGVARRTCAIQSVYRNTAPATPDALG